MFPYTLTHAVREQKHFSSFLCCAGVCRFSRAYGLEIIEMTFRAANIWAPVLLMTIDLRLSVSVRTYVDICLILIGAVIVIIYYCYQWFKLIGRRRRWRISATQLKFWHGLFGMHKRYFKLSCATFVVITLRGAYDIVHSLI